MRRSRVAPIAIGPVVLLALVFGARTAAADLLRVDAKQSAAMGLVLEPAVAADWLTEARVPAVVDADREARVVVLARFAGGVAQVHVREGERVAAGAVLLTLQSPEHAMAQARAQASRLQLAQAERDDARTRALFEAGVVAQRESEASATALATARANAVADQAAVAHTRTNARGEIEVLAPIDGRVLRQRVAAGDGVAVGDDLVELARGDALVAEALLPSRLAGRISVGMRARTPGGADGEVIAVSVALDPETRALPVRVSLPAGAALPGETIELALARSAPEGSVRLPANAVVASAGQAIVFAEAPGGFEAVPVQVLHRDNRDAVVSGVANGRRVVVQGTLALKSIAEADGE
jgi:cobalt-zinc-cadmium efflux system membrane fusion protein